MDTIIAGEGIRRQCYFGTGVQGQFAPVCTIFCTRPSERRLDVKIAVSGNSPLSIHSDIVPAYKCSLA